MQKRAALVLVWLATVGLAGWLGWSAHRSPQAPVPPVVSAPMSLPKPDERDLLLAQIQELETKNAQLRAAYEAASNECLNLSLEQTVRNFSQKKTDVSLEVRWEEKWNPKNSFNIDQDLMLLLDLARAGQAGIDFLYDTAVDEERTEDERDTAREVLGLIRDPNALAALLELPDPAKGTLEYKGIALQIGALSTDEVRPFVSEICQRVKEDLASDVNCYGNATNVLALLAFAHEDNQARMMLQSSQILQGDILTALQTADKIHTEAARRFVERVANDADAKYQASAQSILDSW